MLLSAIETGDWLQPVLSGLLGLAGVVAGAWIATKREHGLEDARALRAEKNAAEATRVSLRTGARLIDQELRDATPLLQESIYHETSPLEGRPTYSADVFTRYRELFAANLPDEEWSSIADAFQHLNNLNWRRIRSERALEIDEDGDDWDAALIRPAAVALLQARRTLLDYTTPPDADTLASKSPNELALELFPTLDEDYARFMERKKKERAGGASE